jgi:hypothetical protein
MGFLKKIKFWKKKKKRNDNSPTKVDACVSTEDQQKCDAATVSMDLIVMCATYTQTESRMDGDGGGAAKQEYERELEVKNQKIRELKEELAVSKRLTAELMININSAEQQLRKYAEEPAIMWSDDCDCKQQVSAVADLFKTFIITKRDANSSKPEATSSRKTKIDGESQTEGNSRKRDRASADEQGTVRRLQDKNTELFVLAEEYERKTVLLNKEMEQVLQDRTSHVQYIKQRCEEEIQRQMLKMRDMRDDLLWYKKQLAVAHTSDEIRSLQKCRPSSTERYTEDDQHNERSHHTGRREAGGSSNSQQSTNQRHHPKEQDFSRKRNLPPRLKNINLPPRLQNRNLQQALFRDGTG